MNAPQTPAASRGPRTVLVVVTLDSDGSTLIITPGKGSPRIATAANAHDVLRTIASDPTVPEHVVEPGGGFSVGDIFRGAGKFLADYSRSGEGGEQR